MRLLNKLNNLNADKRHWYRVTALVLVSLLLRMEAWAPSPQHKLILCQKTTPQVSNFWGNDHGGAHMSPTGSPMDTCYLPAVQLGTQAPCSIKSCACCKEVPLPGTGDHIPTASQQPNRTVPVLISSLYLSPAPLITSKPFENPSKPIKTAHLTELAAVVLLA